MILAEFSMYPLDKGESLSEYVAKILDLVDRSGLPYRMGPMGTTIEGEWDDVMGIIRICHDQMSASARRIECSIKIDYRKGASGRIDGKMMSLENKLGRELLK